MMSCTWNRPPTSTTMREQDRHIRIHRGRPATTREEGQTIDGIEGERTDTDIDTGTPTARGRGQTTNNDMHVMQHTWIACTYDTIAHA
jgi:hypothetical protein